MANQKKTVLLTGAGGSIGRECLQLLLKSRHRYDIRVFDIDNPKNREYFDRFNGKLETFFGDITHREDLIAPIQGVDVVIHFAAVIPPLAREREDLVQSVNINGTRNLISVMEEHAPNAFLEYASSVAVYGDRLENPYISVEDPVNPAQDDAYGAGKVQTEKDIQSSKLQWTIFRLAAIMGAGNHQISGLMFLMPLSTPMEICTPRDTARAFANAVEHIEELTGQIFNLGVGSECVTTYYDFLSRNFKIFGLGEMKFPEHAFATKNFHCGIYTDGDDLENILHFRRDTLEDYYKMVKANTPKIQRMATKLVSGLVQNYLLSKSEPYRAWQSGDEDKIKLYFR